MSFPRKPDNTLDWNAFEQHTQAAQTALLKELAQELNESDPQKVSPERAEVKAYLAKKVATNENKKAECDKRLHFVYQQEVEVENEMSELADEIQKKLNKKDKGCIVS